MLKSELQKYAAPVLDGDFTNIVVSAVRYALPRHSYMPSLTRDYVWKHWPLIKRHHWCILRDIREHYWHLKKGWLIDDASITTHDQITREITRIWKEIPAECKRITPEKS